MKILFTSVGRRVELIQAFRKDADELKIELTIVGADIAADAPALYFCNETRVVCRIKGINYISQILAICKSEKVGCLIPTIDTDLLLLAENKKRFESVGTKVLISAIDKVKLCRDKNYTADYFVSLGLKSPLPVNSVEKYEEALQNGSVSFPAFIKPKDGSSSINAYRVENLDDLKLYAGKIDDYIIQPFISGREYIIDIFCDYEGNPVYITPRERLAVRTVDNYYIEINPRFGGGAPLSIKAGADSARAVLKMLSGEKLMYQEKAARDRVVYSRFDQSVCVNKGIDE